MSTALLCAALFSNTTTDSSDRGGIGRGNGERLAGIPKSSEHTIRGFTLAPDFAARIRARDTSALETLLQVAFEPLAGFAYSFVMSRDAAEDIVQEVLIGVWSHSDSFDPEISVPAYLYAAVRNRALNSIRAESAAARLKDRLAQEYAPGGRWEDHVPAGVRPDELVQWKELMIAFDRSLGELTERQRSALMLRFEQGRTALEISHILGISLKATEKLLSRGLRELRTKLREAID